MYGGGAVEMLKMHPVGGDCGIYGLCTLYPSWSWESLGILLQFKTSLSAAVETHFHLH